MKITDEVPVFPLPNLVFFPKTLLPLHIFEARYRRMVENAHLHDSLIGMFLLREGWEKNYFGSPAVHEVGCVGKIQFSEKLDDGKYNILLYGISRARIVRFVQDRPYRIAKVRYLREEKFSPEQFKEHVEAARFLRLVHTYIREIGVENGEEILKLQTDSLEAMMNQVASILDFATDEKQELLEVAELQTRYLLLRRLLRNKLMALKVAKNVKFVPDDPSWN